MHHKNILFDFTKIHFCLSSQPLVQGLRGLQLQDGTFEVTLVQRRKRKHSSPPISQYLHSNNLRKSEFLGVFTVFGCQRKLEPRVEYCLSRRLSLLWNPSAKRRCSPSDTKSLGVSDDGSVCTIGTLSCMDGCCRGGPGQRRRPERAGKAVKGLTNAQPRVFSLRLGNEVQQALDPQQKSV